MGKVRKGGSGFSGNKSDAAQKHQIAQESSDQHAEEPTAATLIKQGRLQEAEAIYRELIAKGSQSHTTFANLAAIYRAQDRLRELAELLKQALQFRPNDPHAYNNLGVALKQQGDLTAAIDSFKKAIELKHNYPEAHYNLGNALKQRGDLAAAMNAYKRAIELNPNDPVAHYNLGNTLKQLGELDAAISAFNTAIKLKPDYPDAHWNCALSMLLNGEYKKGWEKYEWRSRRGEESAKTHAIPKCNLWRGEPSLDTVTQLLLITEQGLGDTIQFMRYASTLRERGVSVSFCAQPKLHRLIQASGIDPSPLTPEQANQITEGNWISLLSLPQYLQISPDNPITSKPYIKTTGELVARWANILSAEKRPILGINWQGNPETEQTALQGRSLDLEALARITSNTQISLLSLQKGFGSEQLEKCSFRDRFVGCQNRVNNTWDFLETAAIIANCDLIITSDTAVAHLAGGMGKTTWLLLQKLPDWRWGREGDTTFWYPSMRLFRQKTDGKWDEVMAQVAEELQKHLESTSASNQPIQKAQATRPVTTQNILAPISMGELINDITILQIKSQSLQGAAREKIIQRLEPLERILIELQIDTNTALIRNLKKINQDLWNLEEAIREEEHRQIFGEKFIQLARMANQHNERRAAIREEITRAYNSTSTEEGPPQ